MFRRTIYGLANEASFYRVDYVAYCEGATSQGEALTSDEAFWNSLLRQSGKKVRVKGAGCKPELLKIADDVEKFKITTVIICLDADYDEYIGTKRYCPYVLYTKGYSWESDMIASMSFQNALSMFCNIRDLDKSLEKYNAFIQRNLMIFWRLFLIDLRYIKSGINLFERSNPMSLIETFDSKEPTIKVRNILKQIRLIRGTGSSPLSLPIEGAKESFLWFFGKSVAKFVYHWFVWFGKSSKSKNTVRYDVFISAIVGNINWSDVNLRTYDHYNEILKKL